MDAIIDSVLFLVKNELLFREDWDEIERAESGHFNSLFALILARDSSVAAAAKSIPNRLSKFVIEDQPDALGISTVILDTIDEV